MAGTNQDPQSLADAPPSTMAIIIYVLFIVGFFNGLTTLIGVALAHANSNSTDPVLASHYKYQIRTFYWGLLWFVVGTITSYIVIGWFILLAWIIWTVIRIIFGLTALSKRETIS